MTCQQDLSTSIHTNVVGVTKHFLIEFKVDSEIEPIPEIINEAKTLRIDMSWAQEQILFW